MSDEWLELWRQTRDPAVAEHLDATLPQAEKLYPASATGERKQMLWLSAAFAREVDKLPTLLATLHDAFSTSVEERVRALRDWPDDPRISSALTRLFEQPAHVSVSTLPLWRALSQEVVRRADPRSLERLEAVSALGERWVAMFRPHMRPLIGKHLEQTRAELAAALKKVRRRPLTEEERARLPKRARGDLLGAVLAAPDDVELRRVYADELLGRGDVRGELIMLQLSPKPNAAQKKRIGELVAEHGKEWLGALAPVVDVGSAVFERGFPADVLLKYQARRQLSPVLGHRDWNTVHTVRLSPPDFVGSPLELIVHPAMKHLRAIDGLPAEDVRRLARMKQPLALQRIAFWLDAQPATLKALENEVVFPRLERIDVIVHRYFSDSGPALKVLRGSRFEVTVRRAR